jgi:cytoskeletal protein CcmA (bactofilin family)
MLKNSISSDFSINSIIGEHTSFKGIFNIQGPLRIDGDFTGKIVSSGKVIISKTGRAECVILAKNVVVGGVVKGDIYAEDKVIVLKSSEIIGNIYSSSITMDDGVIFNGKCEIIHKNSIKDIIENKKKENYSIH